MESQTDQNYTATLFATAPAFAAAAMQANLASRSGIGGAWAKFSWWMSGRKVMRDLPDYRPAIAFGTTRPLNHTPDNAMIAPTLVIECASCPTPVDADDGMDFIKGYAVGAEVLLPSPHPTTSAHPLWENDTHNRRLIIGAAADIDEIEDPYCREISVYSDDKLITGGNTDNLTWSVADLVSAVSQLMPINDGMLISCGIATNPIKRADCPNLRIEIKGLSSLIL